MTNDENLTDALTSLIDAIDTAPMVVFLPTNTAVMYGPMDPADAMAFIDRWNTFFAERSIPDRWVARPLLTPNK